VAKRRSVLLPHAYCAGVNNKPASDAIPLFLPLLSPAMQSMSPLLAGLAASPLRSPAEQLREHGLAEMTSVMRSSSPAWLADELSRSWRRQWPDLPAAMDEAARYRSPTVDELRRLEAPIGVVGASDDPIHPIGTARQWAAAAPRAGLRTVTLAEFGPAPGVLGAACVAALRSAD
jgi:pimeloyl-ACP methyl ester carboxylesterase